MGHGRGEFFEVDEFKIFPCGLVPFRAAFPGEFEAEGHVVAHSAPRQERVFLKDHAHFAARGAHGLPPVQDFAFADRLQPGGHPQEGGFAASARADDADEFVFGDVEVEFAQGLHGVAVPGEEAFPHLTG